MTIQQFGDATHDVQRTVLEMLGAYLLTKKDWPHQRHALPGR